MPDVKKKEDGEAKPKKGKKGLIIIIAAVLLLAGGGGAGWFFLMKPKHDASADAEDDHKPVVKAKSKVKTFASLDPFTVNLADEGGERFLQVAVVLEVADAKVSTDLTAQMPAVRNAVLMLLSSKLTRDLLTVPGKERLGAEIAAAAGVQLGWEPSEQDEDEKPRKTKVKADPRAADEKPDAKAEAKDPNPKEAARSSKVEAEADKQPKKRKNRRSDPNPIEAVHFAQFIIQ